MQNKPIIKARICIHCKRQISLPNYNIHIVQCYKKTQLNNSSNMMIKKQTVSQPLTVHQMIMEKKKVQMKKQEIKQVKAPPPKEIMKKKQEIKDRRKEEEEESKVPCKRCGKQMTLFQLDTHPNICQFRQIDCNYCSFKFPVSLMNFHHQVCKKRLEQRLPQPSLARNNPQSSLVQNTYQNPSVRSFPQSSSVQNSSQAAQIKNSTQLSLASNNPQVPLVRMNSSNPIRQQRRQPQSSRPNVVQPNQRQQINPFVSTQSSTNSNLNMPSTNNSQQNNSRSLGESSQMVINQARRQISQTSSQQVSNQSNDRFQRAFNRVQGLNDRTGEPFRSYQDFYQYFRIANRFLESESQDQQPDQLYLELRRANEELMRFNNNFFRRNQPNNIRQLANNYISTSKNQGLKKHQIERIPQKSYQCEIKKQCSQKQICSICCCDLEVGEKIKDIQCNHLFHTKCISQWLERNKTCPSCRQDLSKDVLSAGQMRKRKQRQERQLKKLEKQRQKQRLKQQKRAKSLNKKSKTKTSISQKQQNEEKFQ